MVSIITPTYNCSEFIAQTIKSIQAQTYDNWELLITDDASTDNTREIVLAFATNDSRVKYFRFSSNQGISAARNYSIERARGRYIAFCDSDDIWHSDKLEKQIFFMTKHDIGFSYTGYNIIDNENNHKGQIKVPKRVSYLSQHFYNHIGCLTVLLDTSKIGVHRMPDLAKRQDYLLWMKILRTEKVAHGLQEQLASYRIRIGSVSRHKGKLVRFNYTVYRRLGYSKTLSFLFLTCFLFTYVIVNGIKRH